MDGTEDDQIKIRGNEAYTMPSAEWEFTFLVDDKESGSENEFTEVDTDNSNDLTEFARIRLNVQVSILIHLI